MADAARAIIIENGKLLVMYRNKQGREYYTLVGGRVNEGETPEQAVVREVKEETGLQITTARKVFYEDHPEPYNNQHIFLCEVAPHNDIAIQDYSEEALMNRIGIDVHKPLWVVTHNLHMLPFNTLQLQKALADALQNGFPDDCVQVH